MEEMFGNRITGYTSEYYSMLFEKQSMETIEKKYLFLIKKEDIKNIKKNKNSEDNLYKRMQKK